MLIELLVNAFIIVFAIIAVYGHVLLFKALLLGRKPGTGRRRQRAATLLGAHG